MTYRTVFRSLAGVAALAAIAAVASPAFAADTATTAPAATAPAAAVAPYELNTGSTAWMLISSALVLFMMPGLALFYGGMVRAKNVLNTFLNVMVCCGVIGVLWVICGYAIVFPVVSDKNSLIHASPVEYLDPAAAQPAGVKSIDDPGAIKTTAINSIFAFEPSLIGLSAISTPDQKDADGNITAYATWSSPVTSGDTMGAKSTGVPEIVFAMFQGMFAIITPALIVGSVVERVRFGPLLLFLVIWSLIIYCPVAHMVWNVNGFLFQKGVLDFAGGTVVHVLAGVSALALTIVVGPRKGNGTKPMPPHSLGLTLIGAGMLWFGWFGFNAGSAIGMGGAELPTAGGVAALAFATTQTAAAAAALGWMLIEWLMNGKPTILGFASGMVAGLVVITPCAGHVTPGAALTLGFSAGIACYFACQLKKVFKYDDTLDAFGVHGVGGAIGAIAVGYFAVRPVTGGMSQVMTQLTGLAVAVPLAFLGSLAIGYAIKYTIGIRVTEAQEEEGLDITIHEEAGYNLSVSN